MKQEKKKKVLFFSKKADVDDLVSKDVLSNDFHQGKINVNFSDFLMIAKNVIEGFFFFYSARTD